MKVKSESEVAQLCPTPSDLMNCSLPGSSVHGIHQARVLEWAAIFFPRGSSRPKTRTRISCIAGRFFTDLGMREVFRIPWTSLYELIHNKSQIKLLSQTIISPLHWQSLGSLVSHFQLFVLSNLHCSSSCLLSCFSCVRLCTTPEMAAHQAPQSLGFSRQEHWSGLPFPSPMRESEAAQSCPTLHDPMDCSPPGSSVHGIF